jgi:hypothetical protein
MDERTNMNAKAKLDRRAKRTGASLTLLGMLACLAGCPINDLVDARGGSDAGTGVGAPDGTTGDTAGDDAATATDDGGGASDDGSIADADAAIVNPGDGSPGGSVYYPLDDPSRWSFFSAAAVANGTTKYSGVAFDGRYLYFVPQFSPPNVLRYDTQAEFTNAESWTYYAPLPSIVAAGGLSTGSYTYLGGAFDGRYVYLAPFGTNTYAVRYDTQKPFSNDGSWSAFNAGTVDSAANYWGVASDGRYTYFVPNKTTKILAFDNGGDQDAGSDFTSAASFVSYDLGTGNSGFWGAVFDGTYMYFAPFSGSSAARHDTVLPVTAGWDVGATGFDFNNNFVLGPAAHFWASAYDGNRVYMLPNATQSWTIAAYTTSGEFDDYASWSTCALGTQLLGSASASSAFVGAAFDGKRLILVPFGTPAADSGAAGVPIVAYDTTQPLCPSNMASAYSTFDPSAIAGGAGAAGFEGAAFDGRYVYFVPHAGSVVARFEAKSVNAGIFPSTYKGSWW